MIKLDKGLYGSHLEKGNMETEIIQDIETGVHYLLVEQDDMVGTKETWVAVKFKEKEAEGRVDLETVRIDMAYTTHEGTCEVEYEAKGIGIETESYAGVVLETMVEYLVERVQEDGIDLECGEDFLSYIVGNITEDVLEYFHPVSDEEVEGILRLTDTLVSGIIEVSFDILEGVYTGVYLDNITIKIEDLGIEKTEITKQKVTLDERMIDAEDEDDVLYILEAYIESMFIGDLNEKLIEGII